MAFNFSKIEMSHYVTHRERPQQSDTPKAVPAPVESA